MRGRGTWLQIAGWSFLGLVAAGCLFGRVAFTPDSKRFAAVVWGDGVGDPAKPGEKPHDRMELWVTDVAAGSHVLVARDECVGPSVSWTADGRRLWFLHAGKDAKDSWTLARWDGAAVADVTSLTIKDDTGIFALVPPQPLPDGKSVLCTTGGKTGDCRIVRLEVATGATSVVVDHAAGAVLSPKGDRIAFLASKDEPDPWTLCVAAPDGAGRRTLAAIHGKIDEAGCAPVAWSPDGRRIAWTDRETGAKSDDERSVVFVVDVETAKATRASLAGENAALPFFAADGASVFYTLDSKKERLPPRVRRADLATGKVADVAAGEGCVASGVSPDGKWLALRLRLEPSNSKEDDVSVVRLVDLATGDFRDDWVTARQRRVAAAREIDAAKARWRKDATDEDKKAVAAALDRAAAQLDAMAKEWPGSEKRPDAVELRELLARARESK